MAEESLEDDVSHRTVDRIALILDCLASTPNGCRLSELASAADAPMTTVQGIVKGLVHNGFAERHGRTYFLGRATYLLNRRAGRELLPGVSRRMLTRLNAALGLSVALSVRVGMTAYYIDHVSDDPRFGYLGDDLVERPLLGNSAGWVHLAFLEGPNLWQYLASHEKESELIARFLEEKSRVRSTGLCVTPGVSNTGDGISMGVHDRGKLVSVITVIGEKTEVRNRSEEIVKRLLGERDAHRLM